MRLFGYEFKRADANDNVKSPVRPENEESSIDVSRYGGMPNPYSHTMDFDKKILGSMTENSLIEKYREISYIPLVDRAIEEIITDMIIIDGEDDPISLDLDEVPFNDNIKKEIKNAFDHTLSLLHFNKKGHAIARRWYVDGRLNYAHVIDTENPKKGIQELRYVDPKKIKKIREFQTTTPTADVVISNNQIKKYYLYSPQGVENTVQNQETYKLPEDTVTFVTSGLVDNTSGATISWIHKALRASNILRMVEDSTVIYRLNNSAERRIFYIEVGELPAGKAQQYLEQIATKYKNKQTYDVDTGQLRDDRKHLAVTEDFWIPRRSGQDGTQIDTLPAGCLSMDTKVSLLDGRELSISEIESEMSDGKEIWVYSCDPETGKVVPGLVSWAGVTQESADVMRLTLDNGEEVICTPDHKFPVYGKGFMRADELSENESMIPLYRRNKKISDKKSCDYEQFFDNEEKRWKFTNSDEYDNSGVLETNNDPRVVKIEYLDDPIQVGTLTIDKEEIYHAHHTFALSAGIFTKNSNLGEVEDVEYFKQNLYDALNVPKSRFADDGLISRGTEISRDEMKFSQFVARLRTSFNDLFSDIMKKHLVLKGVMSLEDWDKIENKVRFQYQRDNYFAESLENQVIQERMGVLRDVKDYEGSLFSRKYIQRNILRMTDDEIKEMENEIAEEKKSGLYGDIDQEQ